MTLVSTLATNNTIMPAARSDQVESSISINPKSVTKGWTMLLRVLVMREGVTNRVVQPVLV